MNTMRGIAAGGCLGRRSPRAEAKAPKLDPKAIRHARGPHGEDFRHLPVPTRVATTDAGLKISEVVSGREVTPYSDGSEEVDRYIRLTFALRGTATGRGQAGAGSSITLDLGGERVSISLGNKPLTANRVAERLVEVIGEKKGWLVQYNGANANYRNPDSGHPTFQRMTIYTRRFGRDE